MFEHDLALELGWSIAQLRKRMTEREFGRWAQYAARRMLPTRRMEMHHALASLTLARINGNTELTLSDFLFDEKQVKQLTTEQGAMALGSIAGGVGVRKLGQGRKPQKGIA